VLSIQCHEKGSNYPIAGCHHSSNPRHRVSFGTNIPTRNATLLKKLIGALLVFVVHHIHLLQTELEISWNLSKLPFCLWWNMFPFHHNPFYHQSRNLQTIYWFAIHFCIWIFWIIEMQTNKNSRFQDLWILMMRPANFEESVAKSGKQWPPISHHSSVEHPEFSCVFWEWHLFRFLMKITYARSSRLKNLSNLSIIVSCLETCLRQQHYWVQNQW